MKDIIQQELKKERIAIYFLMLSFSFFYALFRSYAYYYRLPVFPDESYWMHFFEFEWFIAFLFLIFPLISSKKIKRRERIPKFRNNIFDIAILNIIPLSWVLYRSREISSEYGIITSSHLILNISIWASIFFYIGFYFFALSTELKILRLMRIDEIKIIRNIEAKTQFDINLQNFRNILAMSNEIKISECSKLFNILPSDFISIILENSEIFNDIEIDEDIIKLKNDTDVENLINSLDNQFLLWNKQKNESSAKKI